MKNVCMKNLVALGLLLLVAGGVHEARADWKDVRNLVLQGEKLSDEDQQEPIYRRAYTLAQRSVAANPKSSHEYLWLANAAGRLAMVASTDERIKLSKVVKENAERAIALDASNGAAYMTLGAWHYYVADLSWVQRTAAKTLYGGLPEASFKDAENYLTRALKHGVENPVEVYYLRALTYRKLERDDAARADLKRCTEAKARNDRERQLQQRAKKRLG